METFSTKGDRPAASVGRYRSLYTCFGNDSLNSVSTAIVPRNECTFERQSVCVTWMWPGFAEILEPSQSLSEAFSRPSWETNQTKAVTHPQPHLFSSSFPAFFPQSCKDKPGKKNSNLMPFLLLNIPPMKDTEKWQGVIHNLHWSIHQYTPPLYFSFFSLLPSYAHWPTFSAGLFMLYCSSCSSQIRKLYDDERKCCRECHLWMISWVLHRVAKEFHVYWLPKCHYRFNSTCSFLFFVYVCDRDRATDVLAYIYILY